MDDTLRIDDATMGSRLDGKVQTGLDYVFCNRICVLIMWVMFVSGCLEALVSWVAYVEV